MNDEVLRERLKGLMENYEYYKQLQEFKKARADMISKRKKNLKTYIEKKEDLNYSQKTLVTLDYKNPITSNILNWKKYKSIPKLFICSFYLDEKEEREIFSEIFCKLLLANSENGWGKFNNENQVIHFAVVNQFFFDCFITTQNLCNLLISPLKGKDWIDLIEFLKCFEALEQNTFYSGFFYREPDIVKKKNITIEKLLCKEYLVFFLVVEFLIPNGLDRERVRLVISMALKNINCSEENHMKYVRSIFEKISSLKGYSTYKVTFCEFKKVVIN